MEASIPRRKTIVFILIVVLANSFGNLLLALGMDRMPSFAHVPLGHYILALLTSPWVIPGALLTAVYTLAQLSLFSWADLSYVIPCTAASYIVTTLLGEFVVGEKVAALRWVGVLLISAGVVLVAETPPRTVPRAETQTGPQTEPKTRPQTQPQKAGPRAGELPPC